MTPRRVAALWLAVSEDKGQTIEGQEAECRAVAARMGLTIDESLVFRIEGESRWNNVPRDKARLLDAVRRRRFDVLIAWKMDRFSRTRKEGLHEIFREFPQYGVTVYSLQESWLSSEDIPLAFRESMAGLVLWLAEEESRGKSERSKLRARTNRNRAQAGGGRARWGRGTLMTADEEAAVLAGLKAGKSQRQLAKELGLPRTTIRDRAAALGESWRRDGGSAT